MNLQGIAYFQTLARYNGWANRRLYEACLALPVDEYHKDRCAFFGSVGNTLNHILVADRIWLARFQGVPPDNNQLDKVLFERREDLWTARQAEDDFIIRLFDGYDDARLKDILQYNDTKGLPKTLHTPMAFGHFFNHQTHHRGQVHNMVSQAGAEPPPLDLLYFNFEVNT